MTLAPRRLVLHIGTPKTGTTSLQIALGDQTDALAHRGVLVPRAGRGATPHVGAHHALASSIAGSVATDADGMPALLRELETSPHTNAIVSSENFAWLYFQPQKLAEILATLHSIGYVATIVLYVREQCAFAESVYAEFVQQGFAWSVDSYVDALLDRSPSKAARRAWTFCFDYLAIADRFAETFGVPNVVVRPYRAGEPGVLLRDFSIATGFTLGGASLFDDTGARHNARQTPIALFDRLYANAAAKAADAPQVRALIDECGLDESTFAGRGFAMLTNAESERIGSVFEASNRALAERYACEIERAPRAMSEDPPPDRIILDHAAIAWNLERI